ncbi:MAG TPA: hypothetical protein VIK91_02660, partial [Nannocystis sp.]
MARRTHLVLQLFTVFAPACPAPDGDDEFGGPALLMLGELRESDARATADDAGLPGDPECGDGRLDPATEECDLGDANGDDGDCTPDCRIPRCGDGLLHPPTEQCDLG